MAPTILSFQDIVIIYLKSVVGVNKISDDKKLLDGFS
jgi:hypothetical protein